MTTLAKYVTAASATYASGVTLSSWSNDPFTFSGNINAIKYSRAGGTNGIGLYLSSYDSATKGLINWSVTNKSSITGGQYGVEFHGPGVLVNSGAVTGFVGGPVYGQYGTGVGFFQAGTLVNSGSIAGYVGVHLETGGLVTNSGHIGGTQSQIGIRLDNAAVATNVSGGVIGGLQYGIVARYDGVSVINAGTIQALGTGSIKANYAAIIGSVNGGAVTNLAVGVITSTGVGVVMGGSAGTVVNAGKITGANYAVRFGAGFPNRLVVDPGAIFNGKAAGGNLLTATVASTLELASGTAQGTLTGIGSKYIGFADIAVDAGASWVLPVANTIVAGYSVMTAGTLTNQGTIFGSGTTGAGATVLSGGFLSNASSGHINGVKYGVRGIGTAGLLTNFGVIAASGGTGAAFAAGGTVGIGAGGTISGLIYGVSIAGGAGTVVNAGTIIGSRGTAVSLPAGFADRVQVYPGAVFTGKVNGGGTASTLELALGSATAAGTITGFGTQYLNFGTIALDSGANWNVAGPVAADQTIGFFPGGTGQLTFTNAGSVAGVITGFSPGETIALAGFIGNATNGTIGAGNTLTITEASGPSLSLKFDPAQSFAGLTFKETTANNTTSILLAAPVGPKITPEVALAVTIGTSGTITSGMLSTTEVGVSSAQLIYSVTNGTVNGTLQKNGAATTTFTQADINSGAITYTESGVAAASDSFVFQVADPNNFFVSGSFPIALISAKPVLVANTGLTVGVSATGSIGAAALLATETGIMPAQLIYTVTTPPADGALQINGGLAKSFTQADLDNGLVSYLETNGTATADSFAFTLSDPSKATLPGTFAIKIIPKPVVAIDTGVTVAAGGTVAITASQLLVTETGDTASQLTYSLGGGPLLGTLLDNGSLALSFTQADINAGSIIYQENGTVPASDAFTFTVTDPNKNTVNGTFPITITKKFIPVTPTIDVDIGLSVASNGTGTITSTLLFSSEANATAAQLTYKVATGPTYGTVKISGTPTLSFTQDDVDNGLITYQDISNSATADAFGFSVTDPNGGIVTGLFSIEIQSGSVAATTTTDQIAAAYNAVLRVQAPGLTYDTTKATMINAGQLTFANYVTSVIALEQALSTTKGALVTIDAFYGATPSSALLTTVTAATSGTSYVTAAELNALGYSDENVWSILGSGWSADHGSAFFAQYGSLASGSTADYTTLINELYAREFGFAPTPANLANLVADVPGMQILLNGNGHIATPIQVMGGIYGYLLEVAEVNGIGQYGSAADAFLRAAAYGIVTYGPELTQEFPSTQATVKAAALESDNTSITISGTDQLTDPGVGNFTIQFLPGAGADTLMLHLGEDRISGFDPATDVLDLRSLLTGTGFAMNGDAAALGHYFTVAVQGSDALLRFDPAGGGGGTTVAVLRGLGGSSLDGLLAAGALRTS